MTSVFMFSLFFSLGFYTHSFWIFRNIFLNVGIILKPCSVFGVPFHSGDYISLISSFHPLTILLCFFVKFYYVNILSLGSTSMCLFVSLTVFISFYAQLHENFFSSIDTCNFTCFTNSDLKKQIIFCCLSSSSIWC